MKAILTIEMPKNCGLCPISNNWLENGEQKGFCPVKNNGCNFNERPSWCPLRPLPVKLYVEANSIEDVMPSEFDMDKFVLKIRLDADKLCALGWNACIEEIENDQT